MLVLDPALPWGQGEGVLAMMYEDPGVPLVPVMVLTDMEDPLGRYGVGIFPVSAYHVKPLPPNQLAQSLRRLLRNDLVRRRSRPVPSVATRVSGAFYKAARDAGAKVSVKRLDWYLVNR